MDKERQISVESLVDILEDIQGGIILCNYDMVAKAAQVVYANRGWTGITGYTVEQLDAENGGNPQSLVLDQDKADVDTEYAQQLQVGNTYELMYRITHRDGELRWVIDKGVTSILPDGRLQNKSIITDVTKIKEREEYMALLARTDQLTKLNNKATFTLLAQAALKRRSKYLCALLMLDIDSFKSLNDTFGHDFGDKVLAAVASQMKAFFRCGDILGRVGGDEFMVMMTDVSGETAARSKTRELCKAIHSIKIPQYKHNPITVSVGVSFFMEDKRYETMFIEADAALYNAKRKGKNQYCIWQEPEKDDEAHSYSH